MFKDQKIEAIAYKRAISKSKKIDELKIYPTMPDVEIDGLVEKLRDAKLATDTENKLDKKEVTRGQQFYVESLIKFSALT
ncbi:MAG: hypothetical protein DRP93_06930, partial [Candidatus Neomarinimicrobiota bacterium]